MDKQSEESDLPLAVHPGENVSDAAETIPAHISASWLFSVEMASLVVDRS